MRKAGYFYIKCTLFKTKEAQFYHLFPACVSGHSIKRVGLGFPLNAAEGPLGFTKAQADTFGTINTSWLRYHQSADTWLVARNVNLSIYRLCGGRWYLTHIGRCKDLHLDTTLMRDLFILVRIITAVVPFLWVLWEIDTSTNTALPIQNTILRTLTKKNISYASLIVY